MVYAKSKGFDSSIIHVCMFAMVFIGLENSTRPLVFTSASGCRASAYFYISSEN